MVMRCVYGHVLAVQAPGRGRGSRAVAHAARAGCAAHDASYVGALQLEGSATQLRMALELVADPTAVADLFRAPLFREGRCEAALALHACGAWPRGALAPAKLLLRHQHAVNGPARAAGGGASMREAGAGDTDMSDACAEPMQLDVPVEHRARRARGGRGRSGDTAPVRRSLLLWVHAAAYSDVHAALSAALEALADPGLGLAGPSGWAAGMAPTLTSRSAQLRRIELVGARAVAAASRALTPAQPSLAAVLMAALGVHSELAIALTDGMALGLRATHPQLASPLAKASSSATEGRNLLPALWSSKEVDGAQSLAGLLAVGGARNCCRSARPPDDRCRCPPGCPPQAGLLVDAAPLWDAAHPTVPSISGSALGAARRAARLQRLHLPLPLPLPGEDAGGGGATTFPALILFRRTPGGLPAVSLVLPAGWVAPVWAALSFSGARPAGQLEWRWLSTLAGLPFFPHDFPDTAAYAQHNEELRAGQRAAAADRLSGRAPPQPAGPHVPWCMVGRSARDAGCSAAPSCEDERPCVARASHQLGRPIGEPLAAATVLIDGKGGCEEGACVLVASTSGGVGGAPGWAIAGFVTTAFPRGHPGYPGGRAYCRCGGAALPAASRAYRGACSLRRTLAEQSDGRFYFPHTSPSQLAPAGGGYRRCQRVWSRDGTLQPYSSRAGGGGRAESFLAPA